jgi:hypothetical protein
VRFNLYYQSEYGYENNKEMGCAQEKGTARFIEAFTVPI